MINIITAPVRWGFELWIRIIEQGAGSLGWFIGIVMARMWGPLLKYGVTTYRDEMASFLPEITLHLRACNDMLLTMMEDAYPYQRQNTRRRRGGERPRAASKQTKKVSKEANKESKSQELNKDAEICTHW